MTSLRQRRATYEAAVRELRGEAERLLAEGVSEEAVARRLVRRRNELKHEARLADDRAVVSLMERRNLLKYGDPLGPGPDWLRRKYGSWQGVIDAACRPADLSGI